MVRHPRSKPSDGDYPLTITVAYRKTGVGVAVGQSFEQAALQYMLTLDLKYPERPNAANGYVSFRQWCVNAATVAIDNMAQDAPADGFGVHCYNKGMAVALPIKLGWVDRGAAVERAFAIIERAGRNSPENAKNSFRNGLSERVRSHNVLLQATRAKRLPRRSPTNEQLRLRRTASKPKWLRAIARAT